MCSLCILKTKLCEIQMKPLRAATLHLWRNLGVCTANYTVGANESVLRKIKSPLTKPYMMHCKNVDHTYYKQ